MYPKLVLKLGREKSLFYRHPWIFSGAIGEMPKVEDGSVVDVVDHGANFLARGYYNSKSNIAVRILTYERDEEIDVAFFEKRFQRALELRRPFLEGKDLNALRLVFAESDGLPGLIADTYGEVIVVQIHTLGMEKLKPIMIEAMVKAFAPKAIYERSDVSVRRQDGLETMPKGVLYGEMPDGPVEIREYGVKYLVDVVNGQKTGFFLDQRENRSAIRPYVRGKKVLNLFSYTGGFSCAALEAGVDYVTSVDVSESALDLCHKNMKLNCFATPRHQEVQSDVFDFLSKMVADGKKFDVVIVDPPAFVKSQNKIKEAVKAYSKLNEQALRVVADGGLLVTSSCSSYVTPEMFRACLFQATLHTKDDLVILEQKTQPFDHPNRLFFPEGEYLKFFILRKTAR